MTGTKTEAPEGTKSANPELSPMMQQFWQLKSQNPDALLFFRCGDFYELFDEDAQVGARELDITLTGRPEPTYPGGRMPMAGVPVKAYESYIAKLISKGYSVAIAEQVGVVGASKGPVERQIVRIITPGTVLESNLLPARENNYLVAICKLSGSGGAPEKTLWGLAAVDASCGEFLVTQVNEEKLLLELGRLSPREILVSKKTVRNAHGIPVEEMDAPPVVAERYRVTGRPSMFFQLEPSKRRIMNNFGVSTLEGFGCHEMPLAIGAAGAVLEYLEKTQAVLMPRFAGIITYSADDYLVIDENSRRNLELTETSRDRSFQGSLLWCIDKTQTGMGSRLLRSWLVKPLLSVSVINQRLDAVAELMEDSSRRRRLEAALADLSDLERLSVKLGSGNINPRELLAIANSLSKLPFIKDELRTARSSFLTALSNSPQCLDDLGRSIESAINEEAPREITLGGIFKNGYFKELDEVRSLLGGGKEWIESFQKSELERTQIKSLKVAYNSNFGYYIEVTHANKDLVPDNYIRKQTLTNAERYITPELKEYESKILNAEKNQSELEYKLFLQIRGELGKFGTELKQLSNDIATLDALLSLATVACENRYTRPDVDASCDLEIEQGRHPVIEKLLPMGVFVANDTCLYGNSEKDQMIILTGPNMAGKSSLLRQVAQIVVLAQIGSFVPAARARVGLVDRIFTRIGAVDDLTQGQSTFLVEMSETTQCCLCASERSLILLDEVGRGTSTYDGVAIAWSVSEYLANTVRARTIFATHYHELNALTTYWSQISNFQVQVAEYEGRVEFLHKVVPGGASRSFGIHVASMAGLPSQIIERSHYLMNQMEKRSGASKILDGPKMRTIPIDEVMQLSVFTPSEKSAAERA
ncbi:MAG: DNA mismatch repair protein MutS [Candidatus Obscuribacterales bacterium]|jgi:DNA mismatch repair protein MutS|nr:DNA mismatch repair protein MutS [Candidatus Obscuribacterales bacterium]